MLKMSEWLYRDYLKWIKEDKGVINEKVLKAISLVSSNKSLNPNNVKLVCGIVKNL